MCAARFFVLACCFGMAAAASANAANVRGFVSDGPMDTLLFRACSGAVLSPKPYRLEDKTPNSSLSAGVEEVRRMMHKSNRPLYIEFRGDLGNPVATARQFQRAAGTVDSCAKSPSVATTNARLLAAGEFPFWRFTVTPAGAQLERAEAKPVRFPAAAFGKPIIEKNARIFDAWSAIDGGTIRVELTEQMCSDGQSETAYGARALVRYGSQSFEGCASRF